MINTNTIINKLEKENDLLKKKKATITKKHFEAVAKIISNHRYIGTMDSKRKLVNSFCDYFKTQNKNFNSIKFYNVCMEGDKGIIPEHTTLNNDLKVWDNTEKTIVEKNDWVYK